MQLSFAVLVLASVASVAYAEDVTLFVAGTPTPDGQAPVASLSLLGVRPLSVDDAGATHYVYSQIVSIVSNPAGATTVTETFKADATRVVLENTETLSGGIEVGRKFECTNYDSGTSVCRDLLVENEGGTTSLTRLDVTYTGTPSPWATVKNVESALSNDEDQGGADRAWVRASFISTVLISFSVGAALVLA